MTKFKTKIQNGQVPDEDDWNLACGDGYLVQFSLPLAPDGKIFGVDMSEGELAVAKNNYGQNKRVVNDAVSVCREIGASCEAHARNRRALALLGQMYLKDFALTLGSSLNLNLAKCGCEPSSDHVFTKQIDGVI